MKPRSIVSFAALGLLVAVAVSTQVAAQDQQSRKQLAYFVVRLGTLGGTVAGASSINNRGWVSGFSNLKGDQAQHAALWRDGKKIDLGTLGGANSGVEWPVKSDRGRVVGISETAIPDPLGEAWSCAAFFAVPTGHTCLGFVWEKDIMRALPTLGGNNGYAAGANNRGQIVGWAENAVHDPTCVAPQVLQFEAVIWVPRKDQIQQLSPLRGDVDSAATAINDTGQVVGISGICDVAVGRFSAAHAVLWQDGNVIDLGNLGGVAWNTPTAINNQGQVVGFSDLPGDQNGAPNFHAFLWTKEDGIRDLGVLSGAARSIAYAINARGQVVGGSGGRAFIWQDDVMTDLNTLVPAGSPQLLYANDINDRGEIVGQAYDPVTGQYLAFAAIPRYP